MSMHATWTQKYKTEIFENSSSIRIVTLYLILILEHRFIEHLFEQMATFLSRQLSRMFLEPHFTLRRQMIPLTPLRFILLADFGDWLLPQYLWTQVIKLWELEPRDKLIKRYETRAYQRGYTVNIAYIPLAVQYEVCTQ